MGIGLIGVGEDMGSCCQLPSASADGRCTERNPASSSARFKPLTIMPRIIAGSRKRTSVLAGWTLTSTRSEEHTSELQSLMRISYDVFCLNKNNKSNLTPNHQYHTRTITHTLHN